MCEDVCAYGVGIASINHPEVFYNVCWLHMNAQEQNRFNGNSCNECSSQSHLRVA